MNCYDPESPEVCAQGYWPNESSTDCRPCYEGYYCDQGLIEECPPGTYCAVAGMSDPEQCPPGQFCEGGIHKDPCPEKTYSEEGWFQCESCPARFFCDGGIKQNCTKGNDIRVNTSSFRFSSLINTLNHSKGHKCPMIEGDMIECAIGEYNDKEGQLTCFNCESGYICDITANVAHDKCPIGYECNDPTKPNLCPPGTNATQLGQTTCSLCDPGFNCADPTNPFECNSTEGFPII